MSKFKNSQGARYLKNLFYEMVVSDKHDAVLYTLKDEDTHGYPSLYRLYMEEGDVTEWAFAGKHLDGYEHWTQLCACSWFKEYADRWRTELEYKIVTEALATVMEDAESTSKTAISSARFLIDRGWKEKKSPIGRPTKEKIARKAKEIAFEEMEIDEDYKRMKMQ